MNLFAAAKTFVGSRTALAGGAAALGVLALVNHAARRVEREHLPRGAFIEVDGVRLHYTDRGAGRPIVLVHGNIRATSVDGALMIPGALSLRRHYDDLRMPVLIMADSCRLTAIN